MTPSLTGAVQFGKNNTVIQHENNLHADNPDATIGTREQPGLLSGVGGNARQPPEEAAGWGQAARAGP